MAAIGIKTNFYRKFDLVIGPGKCVGAFLCSYYSVNHDR